MKLNFILFLSSFLIFNSARAQEAQKPNILYIMADDLTKWDTAPFGSKDAITPTMTELAASGMILNNVYQASPMCSPTRHNLLTGMYPVRTGAYPNHTFVKPGTKSVVQYLKPLGYRVALSGKRHILPKTIFDFEYLDGEEPGEHDPQLDKVERFLKETAKSKQPFCLYMMFTSPHTPYTMGDPSLFDPNKIKLPPNLADTPETRKRYTEYLAEINYLDSQLKQTFKLLEENGLSENTLIVFSTEQGSSFPFSKWTLYNAGITSGLLVKWPGHIKPNTESDALIEFSDILPTFIDVAGGKQPEGLDGSSVLPVLRGEKNTHKDYTYALQTTRTIFSGADYFPSRSVSDGEYRLILNLTPETHFQNVVTERDQYFKDWKKSDNPETLALYNAYINRPAIELYNDQQDPWNLNNLANDPAYVAIIERLREKLEAWMIYCGDEGITTELEADEHTRGGDFKIEPVSKQMVLLPALKSGNFKVPKTGYYSFYCTTAGSLHIDGKKIHFGNVNNTAFANYGIAYLAKGFHQVENDENLKLNWSGPDQPRANFKIENQN